MRAEKELIERRGLCRIRRLLLRSKDSQNTGEHVLFDSQRRTS